MGKIVTFVNETTNNHQKPNPLTMKFFRNIALRFDRSFSRSLFKQVIWLVGIMAVVYIVLVVLSYLKAFYVTGAPDSHGRWFDILFLLMDPGSGSSSMTSPFMALCAVVGLVVFCGMLISLISNMLERRVDSYLHGETDYKVNNHVLILGYNKSIPSLLEEIHKTYPDSFIVLMCEKDAIDVRSRIHNNVSHEIEKHLIILNGARNAEEDLKRLCLKNEVKEIYVLGEEDEAAHDAISMDCIKLLANLIPSGCHVDCHVQIDSHTMFSVLQSVDFAKEELNNASSIDFLPFNFNEIWSQKALATIPQPISNDNNQTLEYYPLYGEGITLDSKRHVHLIIVGMNEMATTLAVNAAHILHFPNYTEGDFSTCSTITFIDKDAHQAGLEFRNRYHNLFQLARWRSVTAEQCIDPEHNWVDPMQTLDPSYLYLGKKNFLDIQWEFIEGFVFDKHIQSYLDSCSGQDDEITTIALCEDDSERNAKLCLALPDTICRNANTILIRQKENPITVDLLKCLPDHSRIRTFGLMSKCYTENLISEKYGKFINACSNDENNAMGQMSFDDAKAYADSKWAQPETSILDKWSSVYSANMLFVKLRSIGLADDASVTRENIEHLMGQEDIKSGLQRAEHNRWVTERLLLGFSPLNKQEKELWDSSKEEQTKLKQRKRHRDICPNSDPEFTTSETDERINSNLWSIYHLYKLQDQGKPV